MLKYGKIAIETATSIFIAHEMKTALTMSPQIETKPLGKSGISVSALALGTWQYQGGVKPLREGIDLGASFIDTAESYGTEEVVGQAIRGIRGRVLVASKALPRHFRRDDLIRAADQSLKRLNTDYIDLYQLHWPNYAVPIEETMSAMEQLVTSGKVRFVGLSNFSAGEVEQAQRCLASNLIVSDQVRYSLVDRTIEDELLPFSQSRQVAILAFSPLDTGIANLRQFDQRDVLGQVARQVGKTPVQVALNWCLCQDPVIVIFKASTVEHVRENCGAAGWRLDPEQLKALSQVPFRRRRPIERLARRMARGILQRVGRNL